MKKVLAIMMAFLMIFGLAACGGGGDADNAGGGDGDKPYVVMITDTGGLGDGSFNDSAWAGFQRAEKDLGVKINYLESATADDYGPNIASAVEGGADLIVCVGFMMQEALTAAADQYPDQMFACIDATVDKPNVASLTFNEQEGSFLAGVAAALTTKTNTVGFVGGMQQPTIEKFQYGYEAGVKAVDPSMKVLVNYTQSFGDSALGKENALSQFSQGADVVYHAAGGCGIGVIDAAKEKGLWAIGVDQDQSSLDPEHVLCSMVKRVDNAAYMVIESLVNNKFEATAHVYTLAEQGVDLSDEAGNLTEDVKGVVAQWTEQIVNGTFEVPYDKAMLDSFTPPTL